MTLTGEGPGAGTQAFEGTGGTRACQKAASASPANKTKVLPQAEGAGVPRDPWAESGGTAEHTQDPHEVTVQLDGTGLQPNSTRLHAAKGGPAGPDGASSPSSPFSPPSPSSDGPVFVDESGRRSRRYRRIGMAVGIACGVYAVVILATLVSGNSDAPWLPVPGQKDDQPAGKVDTPPLPAESAPSVGIGLISPGPTGSAGVGVRPAPGPFAPAPGASAGAEDPGTSTDPDPVLEPTATGTVQNTGTGESEGPVDPEPSDDPSDDPSASPSPDPSPTDGGEPSPSPSESAIGGSPGTVADGASEPTPVAGDPGGTSAPSPSPENVL
ncbi:hypothetical protein QQY66_18545 [Streptomyces sp. DG2A-72]|uniref:hypothetical protein n=1 Tax=Streptomyces sp. DG2A-72 TaxID=3051386 RepID=UPI00265C0BFF|nr:hypothetical protein [Streptomyces sp. DG2A-72]MDO0933583.1 hypothetical protein [Streptomyces sp. DG2A-72]